MNRYLTRQENKDAGVQNLCPHQYYQSKL